MHCGTRASRRREGEDSPQGQGRAGPGGAERFVLERREMIQITPQMRIVVAVDAVDFRRGIAGLARLGKEGVKSSPSPRATDASCGRQSLRWAGGCVVAARQFGSVREKGIGAPPARLAFRFASCYCAGMEVKLWYRGRSVTQADITFIRHLIAEHPTASRRLLSKKLCAAWQWVQPNGALRDMVCRGLMLELHRAGHIELPAVRWVNPNPLARRAAQRRKPVSVLFDSTALFSDLAKIRPLQFHQGRHSAEEPLFDSLLERYHYLA